jgi:hypothetical protein
MGNATRRGANLNASWRTAAGNLATELRVEFKQFLWAGDA